MAVTVKQLTNELENQLGISNINSTTSKDSITLEIDGKSICSSKKLFQDLVKIWTSTNSTAAKFLAALQEINEGLDMANALTSDNPIVREYCEKNIAPSTKDYRTEQEYLKNVVKGQENEVRIMSIFEDCFKSITRQSSNQFQTRGKISTKFDYLVTTLPGKQLEIDISADINPREDYDCKLHKVKELQAGNIMIWQVNGEGYMVVTKDNLFGEVFYHHIWKGRCMKFKAPYLSEKQVKDYLKSL